MPAAFALRPARLACLLFLAILVSRALAGDLALVTAARSQVGKTVRYDPGYTRIAYPEGDVPLDRGVCTDVVVRALRVAHRMDLQQLVHEDMTGHFNAYPPLWGLKRPDPNIDHRRVPNLQSFFARHGWKLEASRVASDFLPGDIVTCVVAGNRPHIFIVSDRKDPGGEPLIIHNIGAGTQEESGLFEFKITGHYRLPTPEASNAVNERRSGGTTLSRSP